MIRAIVLALGLVVHGVVTHAQELLDPNPAIETTIERQLGAFRDRDVDTAWSFAAPSIQGLFRTPENFGRMVQQGYPMVWDPGEVTFMDLQTFSGITVQRVQIIDQAGMLHVLGYSMVETDAGWQINGVQILRAPPVGA